MHEAAKPAGLLTFNYADLTKIYIHYFKADIITLKQAVHTTLKT